MKKNLFRKFLAVFLTGTMLAGVGCKDYDDDIDGINKRLDDIETVKLPGLQTQIEGVKASIPDLTDLTKRVGDLSGEVTTLQDNFSALESAVKGLSNLETTVDNLQKQVDGLGLDKIKSDLEKQIEDLQKYVDESVSEATSEETLSKFFATVGTTEKLGTDLGSLQKSLDEALKQLSGDATVDGSMQQAITAAIEALKIGDLTSSLSSIEEKLDATLNDAEWLGKEISNYVKAQKYVDAAGATDAVLAAINGENAVANAKYKDALMSMIKEAGVEGYVKTADLDAAKLEYTTAIKALETRVFELEGRIQSLVYVPASLEGMNIIPVEGMPYIAMENAKGEPYKFYLGSKANVHESTIEATFIVSPASLVGKLTKENVSFVTEEIATRAAAPAFEIVKVETIDAAAGKFTVTAKTDYQYEDDAKTLAIALNVKIASKGQVNVTDPENKDAAATTPAQGIDYTSAFIGTAYDPGKKINTDLVAGRMKADGTLELVIDNDTQFPEMGEAGLKYNDDKTVVEFFKDVKIYYTGAEDGKPHELSEIWGEDVPVSTTIAPDKKETATVDPETYKDNYELTATTASIKKDKGVPAMIDNVITSAAFSFDLVAGDYTCRVAKNAKSQIWIVKDNTDVVVSTAKTVTWNFATATDAGDYAAVDYLLNPDPAKPQIGHEIYVALKDLSPEEIFIFEGDKDVSADEPFQISEIILPSTPTDDRTEQHLSLIVAGNSTMTGGTYTVKARYNYLNTDITISIPVVIEGMPEITMEPQSASIDYVAAQSEYPVIEKYAEKLWNAAWAPKYFADKQTFVDAVNAAAFDATADEAEDGTALQKLSTDGKIIAILLGAGANETNYTLTGKLSADWGLDVTIAATVEFKGIGGELVQGDNYDNPVLLNAKLTSTAYVPDALNLDNTWVAPKDSKGNEIGKVVFSVDDKTYKGAAVDNDAKTLTWGSEYKGLAMALEVKLMLDAFELDSKTLNVAIADPIKDEVIALREKAVTSMAADKTDVSLNVGEALELNNINDNNVFESTTAVENTAIGVKIAYKVLNPEVLVDRIKTGADFATTGTITVTGNSDSEFVGEKIVKVEVSVTYSYGETRTKTVEISVKQKEAAPIK